MEHAQPSGSIPYGCVKAPRVENDSDYKPGRAERVLIFSMASTCSKLEGGRRVRAGHDDCLRRRCRAVCLWYGQQFSQEYHGKAWDRKDQTPTLSCAVVTEKRKRERNTADIGMKAVTAAIPRKHLETFRMECGDRSIPQRLRAVIWLRRLSRACGFGKLRICEARAGRRRAANLVTR